MCGEEGFIYPKPHAGMRVTQDSNSALSFSDLLPVWGPSLASEGHRSQVLKPRETGLVPYPGFYILPRVSL